MKMRRAQYIYLIFLLLCFTGFSVKVSAQYTCNDPIIIPSVPYSQAEATNCNIPATYNNADQCLNNPFYFDGGDLVYAYTPATDQCITAILEYTDIPSRNAIRVMTGGCSGEPGAQCVAAREIDDTYLTDNPIVSVPDLQLQAGQTYYFIVSAGFDCGNFNFILYDECTKVTSCSEPHNIPSLPYFRKGFTTCSQNNNYSNTNCFDDLHFGGKDYLYTYTPPADQCVQVKIRYYADDRFLRRTAGVAILDDCPENGGNCLDYRINIGDIGAPGDSFNIALNFLELKAGQTYYIVVASGTPTRTPSTDCFPFDLIVRDWLCSTSELQPNPYARDCGENVGFEKGDLSDWDGYWYDSPKTTPGIPINTDNPPYQNGEYLNNRPGLSHGINMVNGQLGRCSAGLPGGDRVNPPEWGPHHTLTTGTDTDPNTDGEVPVVAPNGGTNSVRIGNQEPGWGTECMWTTFTVTPDNNILSYMYAVVLQDPPGHIYPNKPRFEVSITDAQTNEVLPCGGNIAVVSINAVDSFSLAREACGSSVWYQNWKERLVNLTDYIGQDINVRFCTADCGMGGHFGYAYVDTYCRSDKEVIGRSVCIPSDSSEITLTAPYGGVNYQWHQGDENGPVIGTGRNLLVSNISPGDYYTVVYNLGDSCGDIIQVITDTLKRFNLEMTPDGDTSYCFGQIPDSIYLSANLITGTVSNFRWTSDPPGFLSDKQQTSAPAPLVNTTYYVEATLENGCLAAGLVEVEVFPSPEVNFDLPADCIEDLEVQLNGSSTGNNINNWLWNFGDGATANEQNPVHLFSGAGPHTVTLSATNSLGCSDSVQKQMTLNTGPGADFTVSQDCDNYEVTITQTSTGKIESWQWDFGDGTTSTELNPVHTYNSGENYIIQLVVIDSFGCTDTAVRNISPSDISVDFNFSIACNGLDVKFIPVTAGNIVTWEWELGDGTISNTKSPSHAYTKMGNYIVSLTVTDDKGCSGIALRQIVVDEPCDFEVWFPNVFTPDRRGKGPSPNNRAKVRGRGIAELEIKIFDRWGELVYYSNDIGDATEVGWDGTTNGYPLDMDSYAYYLTATPECCEKETFYEVFKKGSITLMR